MILIEDSPVALAALPVEKFKAHLRLGTGFSDGDVQDPVLEGFLRAAIGAIEARTGKALIERAFTWTLSAWRDQSGQVMPIAPVTGITGVVMRDAGGDESVVDASAYRLEESAVRPVLRPVGALLPAIPTGGSAVISFTAGMAEEWGGLPADLGQAVLLLAAHYHEYRHETALGGGCMPFGVTSLIERYRSMRLFMGSA
ncbi:head-tail connector protein [Roseovarius indicus]|uniref:head-tail connector protein n=1 Tax=Roseovarius indicus TaxID=540747 RepID=UPI0032EBBCAD